MKKVVIKDGRKSCTRCKDDFPATLDFFSPDLDRSSGLDSWCESCRRKYAKARYWKNPRKNNLKSKEYYDANKETILPKSRKRVDKWRQDNPERVRENSLIGAHRRLARKANNGGKFTKEEWSSVKTKFNHACAICGISEVTLKEKYAGKRGATKLWIDHVIPLSKGGRNDATNLQPLCFICNIKKSNKTWRTIYIGGSFDLFHFGHKRLLLNARRIVGDKGLVVVAVNGDEFFFSYKNFYPSQIEAIRVQQIRNSGLADVVFPMKAFKDQKEHLERYKPDLVLHGTDWTGEALYSQFGVTKEWLDERGILFVYVDRTPEISSSKLREEKGDG